MPGPEIVFGADTGVLYCVNFRGGLFTPVWQYAVSPPAPIRSSPAIGMVGEGGLLNVVFGCDNGTVHILSGTNGTPLGSFSCGAGVPVRSTPAVADIDTVHFDPVGQPEVHFGAANGVFYAVNFATGGTAFWTNRLSAMPIFSSPAVADLDHDPDLEILVGASDNSLFLLKATPNPALAPVVDFAVSPLAGGRPLQVAFTNLTPSPPLPLLTFWAWDFGDGGMATAKDPVHTYETPGTFTVTLTARNAHGSHVATKTNYITVAAVPLADFSVGPVFGPAPLLVSFTNQSRFGAEAWWWYFGDGGSSLAQHPQHAYDLPGVYTVSLVASNVHGVNTVARTNLVRVSAVAPVARFTQDRTYGCAPLTVNFTDQSAHAPAAWQWNFGDGSAGAQQHPAHTYQAAGRYLVSLSASNAAGTDTLTSTQYVTVLETPAASALAVLNLGLDEGAGVTAHDATTNLNHGTLVGASWTPAGHAGAAVSFRGGGQWADGDCVVVPHAPSLSLTNALSLEAWIKATGTDPYLAIVDKYEYVGGSGRGLTLYLTGGRLRFSVYSGARGDQSAWGTNDLRDNTWHHIAGTWDNGLLRAYVDGVKHGEAAWPNAPAATTANLGIGKRLSGWGGYMPFLGSIDSVEVARLLPASPPVLSAFRLEDRLFISWTACGVLQTAPAVLGPWTDLQEASTPHIATPSADRAFYRLRVP